MRKMRISVVKSKLKCLVYIKEYQVWGKVLGNPEVMIFQKFKVSGRKVEAFIHSIWKVYFMSVADFSSRIFRVAVKSGCSRPCHCILSVPSSSCHLTALVFFFFSIRTTHLHPSDFRESQLHCALRWSVWPGLSPSHPGSSNWLRQEDVTQACWGVPRKCTSGKLLTVIWPRGGASHGMKASGRKIKM